ncbi:MAG: phytanoyl-CoA dioxygenase family protein [Oceanospirillaceae bacterium]|nr:phytanoyl-CoA dioxygenase family protein [Oceanospirillaceae bacterium]MCP5350109.1 phytanoyl-CoA dioxygenase family protein [Oceanospirillaceae bacterium]
MDVASYVEMVKENGYVVIPDVLSDSECSLYKEMLDSDYVKYRDLYAGSMYTSHGLNDKSSEKVVYNMHNKDIRYFDLFDHPKIVPVIASLLQEGSYQNSEEYNLLNISARCPGAYAPAQQLHLDSNLPGRDGYPLIVVALFMLDDFNEVNGATRFVPGSHRFSSYAENGRVYPDEVLVTGRRGSVIIFNGSLWHGSSPKQDESSRWAVILGYGRWFIKPSFDFCRNIPADIYGRLSQSRRKLLGLNSQPPLDEFTRITRRSSDCEWEAGYELPG